VIIWQQQFEATYIREDGLLVLNDQDIPLPEGYAPNPQLRSNVIFPPNARGGDHVHIIREEVFVGFGEGMELLVEDPVTKKVLSFLMDPVHNKGMCTAYYMQTGMPHAVRNVGSKPGYLIELASHPQESKPYPVGA
jgi:hypothetical protein